MVQPMNQFCCGCSVIFGAKIIIAVNLLQNIFYIATTTSNIILKIPTFGFSTSLVEQTFNAALCLLGLPFIAAAIWGVMYRLETNMRLYLLYLTVSCGVNLAYIIHAFALQDVCSSIPAVLLEHGSAFACGFMRIVALAGSVLVIGLQLYCLFTIWSLCEDFKAGSSGMGLPGLLKMGRESQSTWKYAAPHHGEGLFDGPLPAAYGAFSSPGIGGAVRIFGGNIHNSMPAYAGRG
mmetsp:Transcript_60787/g.131859  ORF Transcript_60787/g.131859 Transcript_60787/m.131859 type:complete len:235 (-) Transcript_60787:65-769(-)